MALHRRIYALLLRAYPRELRDDVGDEMMAMFCERWREERQRRGVRGLAALWLRTLGDVLRNVPAEWFRRPHEGGSSVDALLQDVRYAFRSLLRRPGFLAVSVLTLALGVGANAAIFSAVHAVLLRPLPYPDPDALVFASVRTEKVPRSGVSYPELLDWRAGAKSMAGLTGLRLQSVNLTGDGAPERVSGAFTTGDFFTLLGAQPLMGRAFTPAEAAPETAAPVAVIAYGLWHRRWGADPHILGRQVMLNGRSHTIIGVMGPEFAADRELPGGFLQQADAWLPLAYFPNAKGLMRGQNELWVVGRMAPGVQLAAAADELNAVAARLGDVYPETQRGRQVVLRPLRETYSEDSRPLMLILFGAVGLVLLIACVNVANLLLARASHREKELAVRAALGAGRRRLARQLLTESVLLGLLGGLAGLAASVWMLRALVAFKPPGVVLPADIAIDGPVFLYTLGISLATGLLFGIFPALRASRPDLGAVIKAATAGGGPRRQRFRDGLVVAEAALSLILLAGAGLLLRSASLMTGASPGFRTDHLLTAQLRLPPSRYDTPAKIDVFQRELATRLSAAAGVESAALVRATPYGGNRGGGRLRLPHRPADELVTTTNLVTPGYFRTMGIPLLAGRDFTSDDDSGRPKVAVVSAALAALYPGGDAVGRTLEIEDQGTFTVVGVVGDVRHGSLSEKLEPAVYGAHAQTPLIFTEVVVRTRGDAAAFAPELRATLWSIDKDQPIWAVRTMDALLERHRGPTRALGLLVTLFAVVAVLLAGVGLYGVMAFAVAQRTREIGIRMALGAPGRQVVGDVVKRGMVLAALAVVVGLAGAVLVGRVMESVLFGVAPSDPIALGASALVLLGVSFVAAYVPARRAARVDPMVALAQE